MRRILWLTLLMLGACAAAAQQPMTLPQQQTEVKPDKQVDSRDVRLAYEKARSLTFQMQLMQQQYSTLQGQAMAYQQQVNAWMSQVRHDNKWGSDVIYDPDQDKWFRIGAGQPASAPSSKSATTHPALTSPKK